MLLDLRETVRNSKPIKYTLITLICIPFVLVGIGSYFSGGSAAPVAEVNGQEIDQYQLERAYQQQRQQMASMFGGQLPEAFANESMLRQQALQQLISQQVLESEVAKQKFAVGDKTLGRAIRGLPNFQVDGKFDMATYEMQLRESGMSVPMFEQSFRDDTALNQFRTGISDTSFTLPSEAERLDALGRQTRTVESVRYDFDLAKENIEVDEDQISAHFEETKDNYEFPERAKIEYIELAASDIAANIEINEEQALAHYENNRGNYVLAEQREASHILLNVDDKSEQEQISALEAIRKRVEDGESFADLAKEFSDDIGSAGSGGSLGVISPGAMVAEFERAVFDLQSEGDLSDPVVTDFGVHLISLDKIRPETGELFEDVKDEIISTLQQDEADREFFDKREQLIEQAFDNSGSLGPASDATGLEIKTSDWLDSETQSGPVLSHPAVASAMFSEDVLGNGNNSDSVDVGDRHIVFLRVLEHEGPRPKTLDDVREELTDTLKGDIATEQLTELAEAALEELVSGKKAADVAGEDSLAEVFEQTVVDRQSTLFDTAVISRIFSLAQPGTADVIADTLTLADGDQMALRLDAVDIAEAESAEDDAPPVAGVLEAGANVRLGGIEFEAMMESMRTSADVEISDSVSP